MDAGAEYLKNRAIKQVADRGYFDFYRQKMANAKENYERALRNGNRAAANRFDQLYRRTANELNQLVGQESKRFLNIIDAGASAFNNLILGKEDDVKDVVFGEC